MMPCGFKGWLSALTTARDNETPSLLRILALVFGILDMGMVVQFLTLAGFRETFDTGSYGSAVAQIIGAQSVIIFAVGSALRISLPANAGNDGWQQPVSILPEGEIAP